MDFFVISDIHGSSTALKSALHRYKEGSYDKILICGDILYHGARNPLPEGHNPKEVIEILNSLKEELVVVRGNCESEVDSMVLKFPIMGAYSYVLSDNLDIFLTHGHLFEAEECSFLKKGSLFLSGHTHIPKAEAVGDIFIMNPGSISLPKGGFPPSYGVILGKTIEVRSIEDNEIIVSCNISIK